MDTEAPPTSRPQTSIHPATQVGAVALRVADLRRSQEFYERVLGLQAVEGETGAVHLGPGGGETLVELHGDSSAAPLDRTAPGLFHLAILMPDRQNLAVALGRLATARWPLDGASDHLVSEALYLSDPEGNGIEIYRDRPREEWQYQDGQLSMATLPLDVDDLLGELKGLPELPHRAPSQARMGHVHLQVSDLKAAENFYVGVLGFDATVRGYPGALFVSAGGYHHHVGLNTWQTRGGHPRRAGSAGLEHYEIRLPDAEALDAVAARLKAAGEPLEAAHGGCLTRDPSGNGVLLRSA